MEYVKPYDQLIAKRMFKDGYSERYLKGKYGALNPRFVHRLRKEVENGNGWAH